MRTAVVSEKEINKLVAELESLLDELSMLESDLPSDFYTDDVQELQDAVSNASSEAYQLQAFLSDVLNEVKEIQFRFHAKSIDGPNLEGSGSDRPLLSEAVENSRSALLSALNALEGVRGNDEVGKRLDNRAELPITGSELQTLRAVVASALAMHDVQSTNPEPWRALAELKDFLAQTYKRLKEISAIGTAGTILYVIVDLIRTVVEKLDILLQSVQIISV